jgi:predicted anti-sigma-YlaC factor YlaD
MLDGELSQLEQRMVASHLARCADCRSFEASVRDFTLEMRQAPLESPRVPIAVRRARRAVLNAANVSVAAMLAVAALGVVSQLSAPGAHNVEAVQRISSANLFTAGWRPERELAQIDSLQGLQRPGPMPAI